MIKRPLASLRTRLILLVLLALLPATLLVLYTGWEQRQLARRQAEAELLHAAHIVAFQFDTLFTGTGHLLAALARLPEAQQPAGAACDRVFLTFLGSSPIYANIGVIAADGNLLCSALPFEGPMSLEDRRYFQQAMTRGELSVGDYQVGRVTGQATINVAYPLRSEQGTVTGVVYAALSLDRLNLLAADVALPDGGALSIIDDGGIVIVQQPEPEVWVGQDVRDSPIGQSVLAAQAEGASEERAQDGARRLFVYAPVNDSSASHLRVTVAVPSSLAYAGANRILVRNLSLLALTLAAIAVAAWWFGGRYVLRPVREVQRVALRLAQGDLTARATQPYAPAELGELARTVDHMADSLGSLIEQRQRAEDTAQRSAARAEALVRVATSLNASLDLEAVLMALCQDTLQAMNAPLALVYLHDERQEQMRQVAAYGDLPFELKQLQPVPRAVFDSLLESSAAVGVIPDLQPATGLPDAAVPATDDARTFAYAVMRHRGRLIGALAVVTRSETRIFSDDELALLKGLAEQAAQAISNAALLEEVERRLAQARALSAIDQAIATRQELDQTLAAVVHTVTSQAGGDAATIFLLDRADQRLRAAALDGFHTAALADVRLRPGEGYAGQVIENRATLHVPDIGKMPDPAVAAYLAGEGFVSYYGLPLVAEEQITGVLAVYMRTSQPGDPGKLAFLEALAARTAIAVDNANLRAETRRLLQKTEEQANQVRQIIESLPEGVILLDLDYQVISLNPAAESYLPVLAPERRDGPLSQLGDVPVSELLRAQAPGQPWREIELLEARRFFEVGAHPIGPVGHGGGWVVVLRDVTAEHERKDYLHTQDRLAMVGQMAAGIAHDFNNIMSVITLYSGTLARQPDHPNRQHYLNTITSQVHHASRLINQILDFGRQSVMERTRLDLGPFVVELVRLLQRTLPESISIRVERATEECLVHGDPTRLQQALINLALNARDAMPNGGVLFFHVFRLTLTPAERPPLPGLAPGDWVALSVADTGTGIEAQTLPHIFEPFFTTKAPGEGTGLGLAQLYGIVKQHGGEIMVESQVGVGSTFTLYLPHHKGEAEPESVAETGAPVAGGNERILVVEDNSMLRAAVQATLELQGYQVMAAANGLEALEAVAATAAAVDLVISDMVMPEMGGLDLYYTLREQQPALRFILTTGYPLAGTGRELLEQGMVAWVQKPFSPAMLAETVRRVLDLKDEG